MNGADGDRPSELRVAATSCSGYVLSHVRSARKAGETAKTLHHNRRPETRAAYHFDQSPS
jgi:AhpD family alkylhydroperoxidase